MKFPRPLPGPCARARLRRAQREMLRESNRPGHGTDRDRRAARTVPARGPPRRSGTGPERWPSLARRPARPHIGRLGIPLRRGGQTLNRHSPFYIGFVGAIGALLAIGLWHAVGRLATTITILLVSLFLTLALNPLVEWLHRRKMARGVAVALVFLGLLVVFTLLGLVVILR